MGIARHSRDIWASTAWWSRRSWDSGMSTPWTSTCWYGTSSGLACCKNCLFRNIFLGWYVTKYDIILVKKDTKITFFLQTIRMPQMPIRTICTERFSDTFFVPCGHISCTVCAAELKERGGQCHICRGVFTSTSKLFFFFRDNTVKVNQYSVLNTCMHAYTHKWVIF